MNIIAVDDEQGALKLITGAIRECLPDACISSFDNANVALAYCEENPIDIAFLDIQMPVINGVDFAKRLKNINRDINIIFTTGYSEYSVSAFSLRASGYILKPVTVDDVRAELDNLRNPVNATESNHVFVRTFGNFDVFVDGQPIVFKKVRSKELLAYLIDRRGGSVSRKEISANMFEDEGYSRSTQSYMTQIVAGLISSLEKYGLQDMVVSGYNSYSVKTDMFKCDAYDYLDGVPDAINSFHGEYMNQYSWAEYSIGQFYND